jgi:hypothetical protein
MKWVAQPEIYRDVLVIPFGYFEVGTGAPNYRVTGSLHVGGTTLNIVGDWYRTVDEAKAALENSLSDLRDWLNEGLKVIDGADSSASDAGAVPASSTK